MIWVQILGNWRRPHVIGIANVSEKVILLVGTDPPMEIVFFMPEMYGKICKIAIQY